MPNWVAGGSPEIDLLLEQLDGYIVALARRNVPRKVLASETLDLDVAELAQQVRVKLWQALRREPITNVKGYVRRIVYHEAVNMVRATKQMMPLLVDEDGELYGGRVLVAANEEMQDPVYVIEQEERLAERSRQVEEVLRGLPRRQRQAMVASLKEQIQGVLPAMEAGERTEAEWAEEKKEEQRLRTSLSIARKKMRAVLASSGIQKG